MPVHKKKAFSAGILCMVAQAYACANTARIVSRAVAIICIIGSLVFVGCAARSNGTLCHISRTNSRDVKITLMIHAERHAEFFKIQYVIENDGTTPCLVMEYMPLSWTFQESTGKKRTVSGILALPYVGPARYYLLYPVLPSELRTHLRVPAEQIIGYWVPGSEHELSKLGDGRLSVTASLNVLDIGGVYETRDIMATAVSDVR